MLLTALARLGTLQGKHCHTVSPVTHMFCVLWGAWVVQYLELSEQRSFSFRLLLKWETTSLSYEIPKTYLDNVFSSCPSLVQSLIILSEENYLIQTCPCILKFGISMLLKCYFLRHLSHHLTKAKMILTDSVRLNSWEIQFRFDLPGFAF